MVLEVGEVEIATGPQIWIHEWCELWPTGVKSGGYYVKSPPSECLNKMAALMRANSDITKGEIMVATKAYVERMRKQRWQYMQLSKYFVLKGGESTLLSEVHALRERLKNNQDPGNTPGNITML